MAEETYPLTSVGSGDPGDGPEAPSGSDDSLPANTSLRVSLQATSMYTGTSTIFDRWNVVVESSDALPVNAERILSFALDQYLNALWDSRPTDRRTGRRVLTAELTAFLRASDRYNWRLFRGETGHRARSAHSECIRAEATLRENFKVLISAAEDELDEMMSVAFENSPWDWQEWKDDGMTLEID